MRFYIRATLPYRSVFSAKIVKVWFYVDPFLFSLFVSCSFCNAVKMIFLFLYFLVDYDFLDSDRILNPLVADERKKMKMHLK